jgi:amino acid transporter
LLATSLLGIVINVGGTVGEGYIGGKYWEFPGAFNNGFKGFCSVFSTAAFAFAGTELVGLAAAETANPRKSLPMAIKQVFWRISIFYILSLALVGTLVPYTEPRLLGGENEADATASPFVIAIESAGIAILPSVMNGVILLAVISVGNSAVFGSSRTLASLADQRQAPKILGYVDRRGRPLVSILLASALGLLSYLSNVSVQAQIFQWLLSISALATLFTWMSICLAHIRFRQAWAYQSRPLSQLAFRAQLGSVGSWIGLVCNVVILITQIWIAASPISHESGPMTVSNRVQHFMATFLAVPLVFAFWIGHRLWYRSKYISVPDMDIDTGRREVTMALNLREGEERRGWPIWKRLYRTLC